MEQVMDVSKLVFTKARGGRFRWLTISTLMLAIGMLLHLVSPSVAGFTPNWMIACYVVAILLTKPSYKQCLGICMVAALMEVFTSKSAFPYGDFASEFSAPMWQASSPIPCRPLNREIFSPPCHCRIHYHLRVRLHFCFYSDSGHGDSYEGIPLWYASGSSHGRYRKRHYHTVPLFPGAPSFQIHALHGRV